MLALAQWRAGKQVEAETTLTAAERCLRHWWTVRSRTGGYWLAHWDFLNEWPIAGWDWLEFEWYYREAYSQIRGCVPQPDPRNNLVLARTYAALRWNDLAGETFAEACRRMSEDDRVEFEARRHRGYHAAVRGDWPVAVKAFVEIQQQEPDDVLLARFRAMAHLAADDLVEYRRDCGAMLTRYGATDVPTIAWVVLYVCLSDPNAIDNPERLLPIAEIARRGWHDEQRCFGAALYRSGKYAEAAAYLENLGRQYHREPWECCFLAMAYQQLGNARQARLNLELAAHLIDQMDANPATDLTGNIPSWGVWDHRIVALRLLREARALLDGR